MTDSPSALDSLKQIQSALIDELARAGIEGRLRVTDDRFSLFSSGGTATLPGRALVGRWSRLASKERSAAIAEVAERLGRSATSRSAPFAAWLGAGAIVAATALLASALIQEIERSAAETKNTPGLTTASGRDERARIVCEAAESRVLRGGTLGPSEDEGWRVELAFVHDDDDSALAAEGQLLHVDKDMGVRVTWPHMPQSVREQPATKGQLIVGKVGARHLTRLVLSGAHVRSYLRAEERIHWIRWAAALAKESKAVHAAVYARCAHSSAHHVGAWFQGASLGGAAATLLYFVGSFADTPQFKIDASKARAEGSLFATFDTAVQTLSKEQLTSWLAADGGMVRVAPDEPVSIQFPYRDSNRATRASRRIALKLGLAAER